MRPLTERQEAIVLWLDENGPAKHSTIAYGIGMDELGIIEGGGRGAGKGSGHRVFNPAQRIISSMTGLERRGLVRPAPGYKSRLTEAGEKAAAEIRAARSNPDTVVPESEGEPPAEPGNDLAANMTTKEEA